MYVPRRPNMTTSASFRTGSRAGSGDEMLGTCPSDRSARAVEVEAGDTTPLSLLAKDVEGAIAGDVEPASCSWAVGVVEGPD